MGLDYHAAKWLKARLAEAFGSKSGARMLTLGRQHWWLTESESLRLGLNYSPPYSRRNFSDPFFRELGFSCESLDISPSESADVIHDMSTMIPEQMVGSFDVVVDLGTAEHVGDQAAYWSNVHSMLSSNGHVFGVSPASGNCGHGLYQYGPEFFERMGGFVSDVWIMTYGPIVTVRKASSMGPRKINRWRTYCAYHMMKHGEFSMPTQRNSMVSTDHVIPIEIARLLLSIPGIGVIRRMLL